MGMSGGGRPQLPLFRGPAPSSPEPDEARSLHRSSDSAGSREAARYRAKDESRHDRKAAVLEALRRRPWQTSLELFTDEAELLTGAGVKDRTEVARWLPILLRRNLVSRIDPDRYPTVRRCRVAGTPCHRWALPDATGAEDWLEVRSSSSPRRGQRSRKSGRGPSARPAAPPASQGGSVGGGCELCEGRGWVLGSEGIAHPCACRR